MGGTGGPGSDRSAAQTGLQGAGLLAGTPEAQDAKLIALGVENAAQPSAAQLAGSGADSAIPKPTGITSGSDTPPVAATPATTTAPTFNLSTTTGIAPPATNAFALAGGIPNLGFPTGVTDDTPLGTVGHVPFGAPKTGEPIAGPAITGPAIGGKAAAADTTTGWHQLWPNPNVADRGWLASHPHWTDEQDRSVQHADGTWWAPDDTSLPLIGMKFYGSEDTPITAADLWAQAVAGNNPMAKWDKVGTPKGI